MAIKPGEVYRMDLEFVEVFGGNLVFRLVGTDETFVLPVKAGGNELRGKRLIDPDTELNRVVAATRQMRGGAF